MRTPCAPSTGSEKAPAGAPRPWLPLALLLVLAALLRLVALDRVGFWHDEAATLHYARLPLGEIWGADTMPPLYYSLMAFWRLLGEGEWTLRLSSALASLGAIALLYRIGAEQGGPRLGLLAGLLLALSPFELAFAQEYRMYALLELAVAAALLGFLRLLREPTAAARRLTLGSLAFGRGDTALWGWRLYLLGSVVALYTHNLAFLWPLAAMLAALLVWWSEPARPALARNWLLANLVVLAAWAPYWYWLFGQVEAVFTGLLLSDPAPWRFLRILLRLHAGTTDEVPLEWLALPLLLLLVALGWTNLRPRRLAPALLLLTLVPPLATYAVTQFHPIFASRALIWTLLPSQLLAAAGLDRLCRAPGPGRWLAAAALLAVLASHAPPLAGHYQRAARSDWRGLTAELGPQLEAGDLLLLSPPWDFALGYYRERAAAAGEPWPSVTVIGFDSREPQAALAGLAAALGPERRVWVLVSSFFRREAGEPATALAGAYPCLEAGPLLTAERVTAQLHRASLCPGSPP